MTIVNFQSLKNSFRYASRGIAHTFTHEQNFRIQLSIATIIIIVGALLQISRRDWLLIILIIGSVLVLELINTVFERLMNVVEPKIHSYAKIMKDIMAAAVFIASLTAALSGILIFWPYLDALITP